MHLIMIMIMFFYNFEINYLIVIQSNGELYTFP